MPLGSLKQNTTETLFALGDLPEAKGSRSGVTAHTPWKWKASRVELYYEMEHLTSSPLLPQSASLSQHFNRGIQILHPWLQWFGSTDSTAGPHKGVKPWTSTTSHPYRQYQTIQDARGSFQETVTCTEVEWQMYRAAKKNYTDFGDVHFSPKLVLSGHSVCGYNSPTCVHWLQNL